MIHANPEPWSIEFVPSSHAHALATSPQNKIWTHRGERPGVLPQLAGDAAFSAQELQVPGIQERAA